MNQFAIAKENGLNQEQYEKLNIIRGCVMCSFLEHPQKREICDFIQDLEDYFETEEEE